MRNRPVHREIWGLALTAIGLVTVISLVWPSQGSLSRAWSLMLRRVFGLGAYPVGLLLVVGGVGLMLWNSLKKRVALRSQTVVGWEVLFFAGLGLLHVTGGDSPLELARAGKGGGYIGWTLWQLSVPFLGRPFSVLLLAILVLGAAYLATGRFWRISLWYARRTVAQLGVRLKAWLVARQAESPAQAGAGSAAPGSPSRRRASAEDGAPPASARPGPRTGARKAPPLKSKRQARSRARSGGATLPPLDLLIPDEAGGDNDADARLKAQIIEKTLEDFGVPARVVESNRGPVVTQFGVEPGYVERQDRDGSLRRHKIRVSKILALANDLALALAASPVRIEAPVPGRALVGIEVPNTTKSLVGLGGVLESEEFRRMRSHLRLGLGRDVSGSPVVANLATMPHLLVAGATGSGKSVCLNAIIASLLFFNTPAQLKLLLVDPKRVELTRYRGIPHLVARVVVDIEKVIIALRWVAREMDRRYLRLAEVGVRSLGGYNRLAKSKGLDPLPVIVVVIDELADLMLVAADDVERTICRIAQMGRATDIHLVIATQRPSVDVVTGLIKANFPARISFAVSSQVDSRVILDAPGAEKLLGQGDMLFMAPDSPKLQRIQGCFASEKETEALAAFWRNPARRSGDQPGQAAPWEGMSLEESEPMDALLDRATELVRTQGRASVSFLQRQLRIGYPRAARIMDQLEGQGVVGPQEPGGKPRAVLGQAEVPASDGSPPAETGEEEA